MNDCLVTTGEEFLNVLEHHGILGQKWGVRRYQNKDGSLTPAGVKRYGSVSNFLKEQHEKTKNKIALDAEKRSQKVQKEKAKVAKQKAKAKLKDIKSQQKAVAAAQKEAVKEEKRLREFDRKRKEILRDPKKVYQNYDLLTKEEIANAMMRFSNEERLRESAKKKRQAGKDYIDSIVGYADSAIKAWNRVATVYNSLNSDSQLPQIKEVKNQKNDPRLDQILKILKNE